MLWCLVACLQAALDQSETTGVPARVCCRKLLAAMAYSNLQSGGGINFLQTERRSSASATPAHDNKRYAEHDRGCLLSESGGNTVQYQ